MATPVRVIRNEFELQDLIDRLGRGSGLVERDFALVTIAAGLVETFGDGLCFKGGFVLRHVYRHERFSQDIDATRINPPKSKPDATEVAEAIRPERPDAEPTPTGHGRRTTRSRSFSDIATARSPGPSMSARSQMLAGVRFGDHA